MDDEPSAEFGPSRKLGYSTLVAAVAAAGAATVSDAAGRLILGVAALALFTVAASDLLRTPRLAADRSGLRIGREHFAWTAVTVRVDSRAHLGQPTRALEVDDGERLLVLGRHALGADPRDVLLRLEAVSGSPLQPGTEQLQARRSPDDQDDHRG